ncbi:MAG: methyltransferase domain-containing protein, partial [Anaerolineae bacterium]|nr:methyltransferase domain-containing protein [Anaerolineae bacterium]
DAAFPSLAAGQFDVVLCRHLLWALPQPEKVVKRWRNLLKSDGRLVLIEGYWHTDAGLHASEVLTMLPDGMQATTYPLSDQPDLWGGPVSDERYAIVASGSI